MDLPPPAPNETVGDAFEDALGGLEEDNPDKEPIPMETKIPVKIAKKPCTKSPIKAKWIVPLVHSAIAEAPNLLSMEIILLLQTYIIDMFLTNALIQKVRTTIRNQVFGDPNNNVTYVPALVDILEAAGHDFDIYAKTPMDVKKHFLAVVLKQKMNSLKKDNEMMLKAEKLQYLDKWEEANMEMLEDVGLRTNCGAEGVGLDRFLCGVFLSISAARNVVLLLQTVYQADAAHMKFGKYVLYSCYGGTANCNAFPVAFGIIFGNEDKEGWNRFWRFATSQHPCLNHAWVTIITDQQKGLIEAMSDILPHVTNFFCSYHRRKNILQHVKGGKGEYSCHWFYNLLLGCGRVETITKH